MCKCANLPEVKLLSSLVILRSNIGLKYTPTGSSLGSSLLNLRLLLNKLDRKRFGKRKQVVFFHEILVCV